MDYSHSGLFSCLFAYLPLFDWMPDIVTVYLLGCWLFWWSYNSSRVLFWSTVKWFVNSLIPLELTFMNFEVDQSQNDYSHNWGKTFLSVVPSGPWIMSSPVWLVGISMISCPVQASGTEPSDLYRSFFPWPQAISSRTCLDQYCAEYLKETFHMPGFSLCPSLITGSLPCELQLLCSP